MAKEKLTVGDLEMDEEVLMARGNYVGARGKIISKTSSYVTVEVYKETVSEKARQKLPTGWRVHFEATEKPRFLVVPADLEKINSFNL